MCKSQNRKKGKKNRPMTYFTRLSLSFSEAEGRDGGRRSMATTDIPFSPGKDKEGKERKSDHPHGETGSDLSVCRCQLSLEVTHASASKTFQSQTIVLVERRPSLCLSVCLSS